MAKDNERQLVLARDLKERLDLINELYMAGDDLDELEAQVFAALDTAIKFGHVECNIMLMRVMDQTRERIDLRDKLRRQLGLDRKSLFS